MSDDYSSALILVLCLALIFGAERIAVALAVLVILFVFGGVGYWYFSNAYQDFREAVRRANKDTP